MDENRTAAFDALSLARAWLRTAEIALLAADFDDRDDTYVRSARLHVINARADIDEAFADLRKEGKID